MYYFDVLEALHRSNARYLVVGGLAVNLYGVPRTTQDIDVVISMEHENVLAVISVLQTLKFVPRLPLQPADLADENLVREWTLERNLKAFSFYDPDKPYRVLDILLVHPLNFGEAYLRRTTRKVRQVEIPLAGIDDLITMKEFSGREQDLSDVAMLKKVKKFRSSGI
jgi:hypothetical protein